MDEYLQWLLAGVSFCLLAGWLGYRVFKRADANHKSKRAIARAAARAEAQRIATEEAARQQAKRKAAAQKAARAEAARRAEAEAARAEAARLAAVEAALAEASRLAADEAARVAAARTAAQEAARAQAVRLAAEEAARARAASAAAQEAARLEAERQAIALAAAASAPAVAAKTRDQTLIMVADDSKIVRVKTGRLLAQHRYRVSYATDGLDAAQQMQASMPDVVITDVEMPGMDGFELTRHVRENPLTAHIPVIMITAADDRHREDANRAGVSVLLGKPYPEKELIAHIRLAMNHDETQAGALA
ncbi:response regulator [Piscinibacter sp.]|uniref:response regulator n=1 Tax=Piscinibacter sp. TaxID=1903157 RepID=UPI002F3EDDEA